MLQKILKFFAAKILEIYQPNIVAITGSVGKTSTKEAIYTVLHKKYSVRKNIKNYNNEIGLPLTVIGAESGRRNPFRWLVVFFRALRLIATRDATYPRVLVLEMGLDRPGDISYLTSFIKPDVAVMTAIGTIPVHVEYFDGPEDVLREKTQLVHALSKKGTAVLHCDDPHVGNIAEKTNAHVLKFGFHKEAHVRAHDYMFRQAEDGRPEGISFKLSHGGSDVPIRLDGVYGMPQVYAALAAVAVGIAMNMDLVEIASALKAHVPPPGRMRVLEGIKHTWILDDTYNAAPLSTAEALQTLRVMQGKRKVAILGDMKELGEYSEKAHREIGEKAFHSANILVCVGQQARYIADEAKKHGFDRTAVYKFSASEDVLPHIDGIIKEGDLILVKGSQSMRMEKIIEEIMLHPERAKELLVRQDRSWKKKIGTR